MGMWFALAIALLGVAYLLGSIPTGYLAGRVLSGIDIREHGSGSTGATNVLRTLGKGPAISVLAIDILKGVAAILLVRWIYTIPGIAALRPIGTDLMDWQPWILTLTGLAALLGHSKSVWIGFTGGKSVATGLGIFLALTPLVGLSMLATFGIILAISRIVSLSSICGAITAVLFMVLFQQPVPYLLMAVVAGLYVVLRHRTNIQRLLAGQEPKIGQKLQP